MKIQLEEGYVMTHLENEDKNLRAPGHLHFWSFPITFLIKLILVQLGVPKYTHVKNS